MNGYRDAPPRRRFQLSLALCGAVLAVGFTKLLHARELFELTAENFTVYSALNEKETRTFAKNMEQFDRIVSGTGGVARRRGSGPTRIFLMSWSDYQKYFQFRDNVAAYFTDASGISNDIVVPASGGGNLTSAYETMYHEYSHFIMRTQFLGVCPQWFDEGLAELLSTATFLQDRIRFPASQSTFAALNTVPWIPVAQLLKVNTTSREYQDHRLASGFYAQSWLIMHYAFIGNPPFLKQAIEYIYRLNRGETEEQAVQAAFGRNLDALDKDLRAYSHQRAFRVGEIMGSRSNDPRSYAVRKLDAGESARMLGELALRVKLLSPGLEGLFKESLKARPQDSRTLAGLAEAAATAESFEKAQDYLKAAEASFDGQDAQVAASLGEAHLRLATATRPPEDGHGARINLDKEGLRKALGYFSKGLQSDPDDLRAAHDYAMMCGMLGECLTEAANALTRAQAVAPASWLLAFDLAQIRSALGDEQESLKQWRLVARYARNTETLNQALTRLKPAENSPANGEAAP